MHRAHSWCMCTCSAKKRQYEDIQVGELPLDQRWASATSLPRASVVQPSLAHLGGTHGCRAQPGCWTCAADCGVAVDPGRRGSRVALQPAERALSGPLVAAARHRPSRFCAVIQCRREASKANKALSYSPARARQLASLSVAASDSAARSGPARTGRQLGQLRSRLQQREAWCSGIAGLHHTLRD